MNRWFDWDGISMVWSREMVRFSRQKIRVVGGVFRSVVWLFALGIGLRHSFVPVEGLDYAQFLFPGIIAMTLIYTAIQSGVSIIWDREFGFLKEVMVAPVPRSTIVIGKSLGGASTSTVQGAVILFFAPLVGLKLNLLMVLMALVGMFLISLALSALGILLAARMTDFESFGSVQNFITMPMFLLSGAMFPVRGLPEWFNTLLLLNPLTYGVDLMRSILTGYSVYGVVTDVAVLMTFTLIVMGISIYLFESEG